VIEIDAVVFDMDGLLIDTEALAQRTWGLAAADCGFDLDEALFKELIGRTRRESGEILERAFGSGFLLDEFRRRCSHHWEACLEAGGIPLKPGVVELLDMLDEVSFPRAVATSTGRAGAERSLSLAGIRERFVHIVSGDMVERGKPEPDIYLLAAERIGVAPSRCLALEDSHLGVRAAHAAGMTTVMVPDLLPPTDEIARLAHAIVPSLHEVRGMLGDALHQRAR
jgi:HAD superfamily hydrolase (TIGR01509 family)